MHGKFLLAALSAVTMLTAAGGEDKQLESEFNVKRHLPADECRAVLMIEESAPTMVEAKRRCDEKLRLFTETAAKEIPGFRICATPMVVERRDGPEDGGSRLVFLRGITVSIPPEEALAVKLLDIGTRCDVKPAGRRGSLASECPVGFTVGDEDENEKILGLYAELLDRFRNTIGAANRSAGGDAMRLYEIKFFFLWPGLGSTPDKVPVELLMTVHSRNNR